MEHRGAASEERAEPRWLDDDQQRSWRALILGIQLLFDQLEEDLSAYGISLGEYEILARLSEADGGRMRMAVLAASLAHSRSRVTHTITRMERNGLVKRISTPEDGRGVFAQITAEGRSTLVNLAPVHVQGVRDYLVDVVDRDDFATFGKVLMAMCDRLVGGTHPDLELRPR